MLRRSAETRWPGSSACSANVTGMDPLKAELRDFALSLPEAWEDHPWGESVVKVGKKIFVFLGADGTSGHSRSFTVKLPKSQDDAAAMPWTSDPGYGLGRGGWLTVNPPEDAPIEMLRGWVEESYRAVAPKKVAARLDER
jgi:predicted DNA-binding protein (MmcQ/YjbR family)